MMKFSRSSKKKEKSNKESGSSSQPPQSRPHRTDVSVGSHYSDATGDGGGTYSAKGSGGSRYRSGGGYSVRSSAQSVASISSASVFAPSVAHGGGGGATGLQPSSSRTLHDLNSSRRSSLLTSIGTAASRTLRSYKMTLPKGPPPIRAGGGGNANHENGEEDALESDLELLGRTVHAVSSALTEPAREGDKYMIYDVAFNPKGCVWDALLLVLKTEDEDDDEAGGGGNDDGEGGGKGREGRSASKSRSRSRSQSKSRRSRSRSVRRGGGGGDGPNGWDMEKTFSFPIRVTCAEDDDYVDPPQSSKSRGGGPPQANNVRHAKTYAVDLSVVDDSPDHPISQWSSQEASENRGYMKNAMEWVSFAIRRSMARSMFPQFPEGCQGKPFREVYQLNKKVSDFTIWNGDR